MIQECETCGTKYNDQTSDECPACCKKLYMQNKMSEKTGDVDALCYFKQQLGEKRRSVNSTKNAQVSKYESQNKKSVYKNF